MPDRPHSHLTPTSDLTRRRFLAGALAAGAGLTLPGCALLPESLGGPARVKPYTGHRYKIGVCDWMILERNDLDAFERTHQIGADGVEIDMGNLGDRPTFASKFSEPGMYQRFLDEAANFDLQICSMAMSGFYAQSFAERPTVDRMVNDTFLAMRALRQQVVFLPLGPNNLADGDPAIRTAVVNRLRRYGRQAQAEGFIIGIETDLNAAGDVAFLDEVGSSAVQIYFNFSRAVMNGRDIHAELRTLGRDRICQIHATRDDGVQNDGKLIEEDPLLDMPAIKQTLDDIGWSGWLVLERSRDKSYGKVSDVVPMFGANARYMKSIFQQT